MCSLILPTDFTWLFIIASNIKSELTSDQKEIEAVNEFFDILKYRYFASPKQVERFSEICSLLRKEYLKLILVLSNRGHDQARILHTPSIEAKKLN